MLLVAWSLLLLCPPTAPVGACVPLTLMCECLYEGASSNLWQAFQAGATQVLKHLRYFVGS